MRTSHYTPVLAEPAIPVRGGARDGVSCGEATPEVPMFRSAGVSSVILASVLAAPSAAQQTYRVGVDLIDFAVIVTDRQGQPITGLTAKDFEVREEGRPQTVKFFAAGDPEAAPPLHIGLLLDTSGSMTDDLEPARSAAVKFVNTMNAAADVTFVDFDTEVRVARFGPADYPRLVERIRMRKADGWTALYDALGVYLNGAFEQDGQKVLVLYTDGGDTRSSLTYSEALDLLKASDVTVYAVGYLQHQSSSSVMDQRMQLSRFAELTGGQAYFPSGRSDLDEAFDKIRAEIGARYSLGYVSTDRRMDGAWRDVEIRLRRPDLKGAKLRTRSGYYAPYRESQGR